MWAALAVPLIVSIAQVSPAPAWAESVTIAGVPFPVDSLTAVGAEKVTVRIGGAEALIPRAELEDFVVRESLGVPARAGGLPDRALIRFAELTLSTRPVWSGLALRAVRSRALGDNPDLVEAVTLLHGDPARSDAFQAAARRALVPVSQPSAQPRATALLVFVVGLEDPTWIASQGGEYLRVLEKPIKDLALKEGHEGLRLRDLERVGRIGGFLATVYGPTDETATALVGRLERVREVALARSTSDIAALARAANPDPRDPLVAELIIPAALEGLHAAAAHAIDAGRLDDALDVLARINPLVRTESTHELTRRALERIDAGSSDAIARPDVLNFIDVIGLNDPRVAAEYARVLAAQATERAQHGAMQEAEALAERLERLAGSEQALKDAVFLRFARSYLARGEFDRAERSLDKVVAGGTAEWFMRLRLSILQMPPSAFTLLLVLFFALGVTLILSLKRGRRVMPLSSGQDTVGDSLRGPPRPQRRTDASVDEEPLQDFVVAEHRRLSPSAQEYQRCLEVLGLTPAADVRAIKNAYRTLVKDVHPDRQRAHDEAASARFIELTQVYDRILELRREFGYDD